MILQGTSVKKAYLKACDVDFSYRRGNFSLRGIDLNLYPGEFTAIVGANGSGKTTMGKLLAGILKPDSGRVLIAGTDSRDLSLGQIGKRVGYLFQQPERQLFTSNVEQELRFALELMGEPPEVISRKVKRMMETFSLLELKGASPVRLSAGEKQRLALAAVLINKPGFLILDEPTTGLDPVRKRELTKTLNVLKSEGIGLAVISHDSSFVRENADRIVVMAGGEIVDIRSQN